MVFGVEDSLWGERVVAFYRSFKKETSFRIKEVIKQEHLLLPHEVPKLFFNLDLFFSSHLKPSRERLKALSRELDYKDSSSLCLLHGFMGDKSDWKPLELGQKALYLDLPFHGNLSELRPSTL